MNLNDLSDDELDNLRRQVLIEEERRQARDQIPAQIADLSRKFAESGGDPEALVTALTEQAE